MFINEITYYSYGGNVVCVKKWKNLGHEYNYWTKITLITIFLVVYQLKSSQMKFLGLA